MIRAAEEFLAIEHDATTAWKIGAAFGVDVDGDDAAAAALQLADLGLRFTRIVREPAFKMDAKKAARDAELGRPTMHLARQWRHPLGAWKFLGAEQGVPAIILPVGAPRFDRAHVLSLATLGDDGFVESIADLIAVPLDGDRPLSLTGFSAAVGDFAADDAGRLVVHGNGVAWLAAHLARLGRLCGDTPEHLIEQLHMPFAAPAGVLAIEPRALEWRIWRQDCVIPEAAREVVCPDSRRLAETIDALMRKPHRAMPVVRGPAQGALKVAA